MLVLQTLLKFFHFATKTLLNLTKGKLDKLSVLWIDF